MSDESSDAMAPSQWFEDLCQSLRSRFSIIEEARKNADAKCVEIARCVADLEFSVTSSLLVFGSLARREWTSKSDVDWALLVDGPSSLEHARIANVIDKRLREAGFVQPGSTGTFGLLINSHDLVHNVGGINDSNQNMTRRLLLLLESRALAGTEARRNVINSLLRRYIVVGRGVGRVDSDEMKVPRFLLNDIVRLWRTFGVDYAAKKWQQADQKWALRNAKLRVSRKLTFAKGLLLCLDCKLCTNQQPWTALADLEKKGPVDNLLAEGCEKLVELTPIDMLCRVLGLLGKNDIALRMLNAYDRYLAFMNDEAKRNHLENNLEFDDADDDAIFMEIRQIGDEFGDALEAVFFRGPNLLTQLTQKYGLF